MTSVSTPAHTSSTESWNVSIFVLEQVVPDKGSPVCEESGCENVELGTGGSNIPLTRLMELVEEGVALRRARMRGFAKQVRIIEDGLKCGVRIISDIEQVDIGGRQVTAGFRSD